MERSTEIGDLMGALAKAQGGIKAAVKGKENPFYKSSYADLPRIVEACREQLSKNSIAYVQSTQFEGDSQWIETMLGHSSGQWISSRYPVRPVKNDPQGLGSAVTYARRYSLAAIVGVVAEDEDDDGQAAVGKPANGNSHDDTAKPPLQRAKAGNGDPALAAAKWAAEAETTVKAFIRHTDLRVWEKDNTLALQKLMTVDKELGRHLVGLIADRFAALNPSTLNAG